MIQSGERGIAQRARGLSAFSIKLIAMALMLCDHVAAVFGWTGWAILPNWTYGVRYVARLSFPVFAYFIVVGWDKTRDRAGYLFRLFLCALFSQIPFSLAFYATNQFGRVDAAQGVRVRFSTAIAAIGVLFALAYWYFFLYRKKSCKYALGVLAACLLPGIYLLDVNGVRVIGEDLNVLYTLGLGAFVLFAIDNVRAHSLRWWEYLFLFAALGLGILAFGLSADYGIGLMGIVLITALYLSRGHQWLQSGLVFAWGCVYYGVVSGNPYSAMGTILASALILTYNRRSGPKGRGAKYLFYVFYPAHLLLIGLVNVWLKLL